MKNFFLLVAVLLSLNNAYAQCHQDTTYGIIFYIDGFFDQPSYDVRGGYKIEEWCLVSGNKIELTSVTYLTIDTVFDVDDNGNVGTGKKKERQTVPANEKVMLFHPDPSRTSPHNHTQ